MGEKHTSSPYLRISIFFRIFVYRYMAQDNIDIRRLTEDHFQEEIHKGLIIRRYELSKQKAVKEKYKIANTDYTFLQFHHVIWKWATSNHDITSRELNTLLYVQPLVSFTNKQFREAQKEMGSTSDYVFFNLKKKGWIVPWNKQYYMLSKRATFLVNKMHRMFMLEEPIPNVVRGNVLLKKSNPNHEKMKELFTRFNKKVSKNLSDKNK